jgi:hypothetical protein
MKGQTPILAAATLLLSACDRFFTIEAVVTDCGTQAPLAGVKATLKLDRGVGEPDLTKDTRPDGRLHMLMNEPPTAWATLKLERPGYQPWTRQFQGSPRERPLRICLEGISGQ